MNINFYNKNSLDNDYFYNKSNFENSLKELGQYKLLVNELREKVDDISQLCIEMYNKYKLPQALELSKQIILSAKKVVYSFREKKILKNMSKLGNGVYKLIIDDQDALKVLIGEAKNVSCR
ncbi:MAG: hypothetical protein L3J08_06870 [Flavobacteriaceae bacterium]|nr:hypothetical protein [Flavobacteriaceae bacterium]